MNPGAREAPADVASAEPPPSPASAPFSPRLPLEFVIGLLLAGILGRNFVAEAYLVPSGSMAPSLLGFHKRAHCSACGDAFAVGVEDASAAPREVTCPNCGNPRVSVASAPVNVGDRLLVQKWVFDFRPPRRWETVVFRNPNDDMQAYVKRVVGLPGESVRIVDGDIYVDGAIARKTFDQFLELRLPVHHQGKVDPSGQASERWIPANGQSRWAVVDDRFVGDSLGGSETDWLHYRHHDPDGFESPPRDDHGYNALRGAWHYHLVGDLSVECLVNYKSGNGFIELELKVPTGTKLRARFDPNDRSVQLWDGDRLVRSGPGPAWSPRDQRLTLAYFDRRAAARVGSAAPFADYDLDDRLETRPAATEPSTQPAAVGVSDLSIEVHGLAIDRDIHYGSHVLDTYRPAAVHKPFLLAADEYFVLGDNSPISNDSRVWDHPAIRHSLLVGKPILVHLPSQTWQGHVFGRPIPISLPDLGNMRRVR